MRLFDAKLKFMRAKFDARGMTAYLPASRLVLAYAMLPVEDEDEFRQWVETTGLQIENPSLEEESAEVPLAAESPQPDPSATSSEGLVKVPVKIDEAAERAKDAADDRLTEAQKAAHNDSWVAELKRAADAKRGIDGVKVAHG